MTAEGDDDEQESERFAERIEAMRAGSPAERIVAQLWADVTARRGWRQEADQFAWFVRHEILDDWLIIVKGTTE